MNAWDLARTMHKEYDASHRKQSKRDLDGLQDVEPLVKDVQFSAARLAVQQGHQKSGHKCNRASDADALPLADAQVEEAAHHKLPRVHSRDRAALACADTSPHAIIKGACKENYWTFECCVAFACKACPPIPGERPESTFGNGWNQLVD